MCSGGVRKSGALCALENRRASTDSSLVQLQYCGAVKLPVFAGVIKLAALSMANMDTAYLRPGSAEISYRRSKLLSRFICDPYGGFRSRVMSLILMDFEGQWGRVCRIIDWPAEVRRRLLW